MTTFGLVHLEFLGWAAMWTAGLSVIAFLGGGFLGFLVALARVSSSGALRTAAAAYIQIVQGTPLLVLLFLIYFGIAILGFDQVPAIIAAAAGLIIYSSGFLGEIWRGCIESVPKTQWEAAECLALSRWQRMIKVILPQALRIATPPTVGFLVQIVKNTSLASVVGFVELSQAGKLINNSIFEPFTVFIVVAVFYFAMCFPLSLWSRNLERKLNVANR
ncbi:amino acid ABC transporter permease [Agrobacterium sp. SHOUNA12C]|uniref:Amino acid ABC transporter permease protein n=1 Tax=Rhizobium rhizogenes NBRC 13257 TaxID=1220581 RepID=A0AA87UCR8_RHIRH|nr:MULTISPECIES: amino acid ABC transporter permease [Rhizobium]MCJ9720513.1 amino acid ABC transporter permease [Agrobacterium sp. BETTINA12B]MCJ9760520.1 amino acid ABC transporter permease [Agrobacterium sp. SHOUNA12C]EJK81563.1 amine acid ABC transporter, permease protein, 3-TM region, His/Glu/Gln/Arg/opine family [Rhizobium sp. AP16]NTF58093.1 amino acid ABC transporter permease [Rhizobium rhizogenes]NTF64511.1 amino acid ABC transporter permease [Rhizobium rhizogenes]